MGVFFSNSNTEKELFNSRFSKEISFTVKALTARSSFGRAGEGRVWAGEGRGRATLFSCTAGG